MQDDGARAGVAAVAQRDRRAQDRVAAHEHVVADDGAVLAHPIVIGGDRTGTQVDADMVPALLDYPLAPGTRLILGGAVRFKFEIT